MKTPFVKGKRPIVLLGLVFTLIVAGAAPLLGGEAADAAKKGKRRQAAGTSEVSAEMVQRFENTEVRLGIIDGIGTVASSSAIEVSGLDTVVTDVDVNLIDIAFSGNSTQDIDVLLIGPEGRTALILSDVGGNTTTTNVTLVLDDQQPEQLPSNAALTNGFFQPTNVGSPDTMNLGAGPFTPPSGASLGAFNGIDPNGAWRLFVFDDEPNGLPAAGSGINGGWALTITTAELEPPDDGPGNGAPAAAADRFQAKAGKPLSVNARGVLENDSDPDGEALTATLADPPKKGTVELGADGSFTYTSRKKAKGIDSFTYLAADPSGLSDSATVDVKIKAKKKGKGGKRGKK